MAFLSDRLTASATMDKVGAAAGEAVCTNGAHRAGGADRSQDAELRRGGELKVDPGGVAGRGTNEGAPAALVAVEGGGAAGAACAAQLQRQRVLSYRQLAAEAAAAPELGLGERSQGAAVSQHRVFLALLNMAHQNNVAVQQQRQHEEDVEQGNVGGDRRGRTAASGLSRRWADGVMRLITDEDGDVLVKVQSD